MMMKMMLYKNNGKIQRNLSPWKSRFLTVVKVFFFVYICNTSGTPTVV